MEGFLRRAQGWQYYYNVERPHFGVGMNGKSPLEKLQELGWDLPDKFACFPVILLDEVAVIWASKGGHDVLAYYIYGEPVLFFIEFASRVNMMAAVHSSIPIRHATSGQGS